jgi:transposase
VLSFFQAAHELNAIHYFIVISMKRSYTFGERKRILEFVSSAKERSELSSLNISQLLELACLHPPIPHANTYFRWNREQLSLREYKARHSSWGRHRKLSEQQEKLLVGYACDRRRSLLPVTQADLIDFAKTHFNVTLSKPNITAITKRAGFSSQKAMNRESRMTTQKVADDSIAFLEEVRSYQYSLDRILIMDETGLWSNVVAPRTLHFINGYATSVFLKIHVF